MRILEELSPKQVFYYFEEICSIPHGSGNVEQISDFLADFGRKQGLEVYQDSLKNVILIKEATKGYEDKDAVILQGHMDMVCEKYDDFEFDFSKDPIPFEVEDDFIISKNTTLGADNGIAVAISLAILEDKTILGDRGSHA